jgi:hypothetical protein
VRGVGLLLAIPTAGSALLKEIDKGLNISIELRAKPDAHLKQHLVAV